MIQYPIFTGRQTTQSLIILRMMKMINIFNSTTLWLDRLDWVNIYIYICLVPSIYVVVVDTVVVVE